MRIWPGKTAIANAARALFTGGPVVPGRGVARHLGMGLLAVVIAGGATQVGIDQATRLPDDAAFRIGGVTTTTSQLDRRVELLSALYGVQRPSDPAKTDQFTRDTAKAVAVSDILDKAAADQGIVIADKVASDQLDKIIAQDDPQGRQDFVAKLGQYGVSEQDVLTEIKRQLANAKLYDAVTKNVPAISDDELKRTFDERKPASPEQRHLRNIVVASPDVAANVAQRARAGEDFAALANETSQDQSTKANGGDLGTVAASQLESGYADAAFKAAPGAVFGPVQTQSGWNVGQVAGVVPGQPLVFDQVKDQFRGELEAERKTPVWTAWLAGQIKAAGVEYAAGYRPADPDSAPGGQP